MSTKLNELGKAKQNALYNYESHCAATNSAIAEIDYCQREQAKAFELFISATKDLDSAINEERDAFYWDNPESMPDSVGV
jgi:hypothetical protein